MFATTRWSVVLAAHGDSDSGRAALEVLCSTYWFPVYAVVRKQGFDPDTARDFTQEFFARLLARDGFANVRRERGRFRSYLAQGVRNFLHDEWDRARAQKRGSGRAVMARCGGCGFLNRCRPGSSPGAVIMRRSAWPAGTMPSPESTVLNEAQVNLRFFPRPLQLIWPLAM